MLCNVNAHTSNTIFLNSGLSIGLLVLHGDGFVENDYSHLSKPELQHHLFHIWLPRVKASLSSIPAGIAVFVSPFLR